MYNVTITREVSDEDINTLADNLRIEEVKEVWASSGSTPYEAISQSVDRSHDKFVAWQDGKLLCISGVYRVTVLANSATPWLLTSNDMKSNPRALIYYSKKAVQQWATEFDVLTQMVDARYEQSLRWARHVGFTVYGPVPFGPFNMPFHPIKIIRK